MKKIKEIRRILIEAYPNLEVYSGSKILITGGTGFKGTWLKNILLILGANIYTLDINSISTVGDFGILLPNKSKIICNDICAIENNKILIEESFNFIFHLAAQPLVIPSVKNPLLTWQTNVMGTLNILEIARHSKTSPNCIIVTSDKVYNNSDEKRIKLDENSLLGGKDPYSSSKTACEIAVKSWIETYGKEQELKIGTVREEML